MPCRVLKIKHEEFEVEISTRGRDLKDENAVPLEQRPDLDALYFQVQKRGLSLSLSLS